MTRMCEAIGITLAPTLVSPFLSLNLVSPSFHLLSLLCLRLLGLFAGHVCGRFWGRRLRGWIKFWRVGVCIEHLFEFLEVVSGKKGFVLDDQGHRLGFSSVVLSNSDRVCTRVQYPFWRGFLLSYLCGGGLGWAGYKLVVVAGF